MRSVPEVLQSGHHERIARWRRDQALQRTASVRPDLLRRYSPASCDDHDLALLETLGWYPSGGGFSDRPPAG